MEIGSRIKQRRIDLGLTADDLAAKIGKSRATIYRYENGDIENMPTTVLEPLAEALYTTPAYLMGWSDDQEDWERIANEQGICPPNDFEGDPEDWYRMKNAAAKDHEQEESELTKKLFNDIHFEQLAASYVLLNTSNKHKVVNYTEKLLDIQSMEDDKPHPELQAAHERTDIEVTDEMRKHDDDIMNDDDFWK